MTALQYTLFGELVTPPPDPSQEDAQEELELPNGTAPSPEWTQKPAKELWGLELGCEVVILATGKVGVVQDWDRENKKVLVVGDYGAGKGVWLDPFWDLEIRPFVEGQ